MYFQLVPVTPKEAAELLRNGHPVVYDKQPVRRKHYDECASSAGTDKRDSSHKDDILLDYWYFDYLRTKTRKDSDSVTEKKPSSSDDMEDPYSSDQDPVSDFEERTRMKYEAILKSEEEIFNQNLYTPSRSVNFESDSFDREYSPSGRSYSGNGDWGDSGGGSGGGSDD